MAASRPDRDPSARPRPTTAPVAANERITTLDAVRGVAVLGILTMNAVSYGLSPAAYFNLDADGSDTWLDWLIGGAGEVLFDQKFMGLFSLLFGAGIVLFADRAESKGRRAGWFSLWRNFLLLLIGLAHMAMWDGDILVLYAVCAPLVILLRRRRPATLLADRHADRAVGGPRSRRPCDRRSTTRSASSAAACGSTTARCPTPPACGSSTTSSPAAWA